MNNPGFYIKKYVYSKGEDIDLSFVPKLMVRRLNLLNKISLSAINKCFDEDVENIIYASKYGEMNKLLQIIEQYREENEVSPSLFSTSVHNSSVGLFSFIKKYSKTYTSLSGVDSTISGGLLSAITNNKKNVLFCYADVIGKVESLCIYISKDDNKTNSKKIILKNKKETPHKDDFMKLVQFLDEKKDKIEFSIYSLERIKHD